MLSGGRLQNVIDQVMDFYNRFPPNEQDYEQDDISEQGYEEEYEVFQEFVQPIHTNVQHQHG